MRRASRRDERRSWQEVTDDYTRRSSLASRANRSQFLHVATRRMASPVPVTPSSKECSEVSRGHLCAGARAAAQSS